MNHSSAICAKQCSNNKSVMLKS